jgi:DNA topoisomerase I
VKSGRYGAYVTAGGVNATIPSDKTQDTITLPEAIALIDERVAKGGGKPKRVAKTAAKKAAAKPAKADGAAKPAKKAAVKKAAAKPKSDAVSKARAPVTATAKTSATKTSAAKTTKPVAKKSAGKASG